MRLRTTIILLLLLIGLGAYVYWVEYPKAQEEAKKKTLFELKADDVTDVTLSYADREIVLKKSGDNWRLTKPIDAAADSITVKNLINAVAECEVKKELTEASSELSTYGLDQPFVKVTIKVADKELPTVFVGKNTPVGFSTYIQRADDKKIRLTSSAFRSGMDKQLKDLRDKTIVTFEDRDVQKVVLHADGKNITLAQKDDVWSIEAPGPYAADATTTRGFLSTLRSMRAVDFPDATDPSPYGFDKPRLQLTLYIGKDNAEKTLLFGGETEKKEVYLQSSGQPPIIYTVSDWVLRDLNKSVADFRDKTPLAFDREKAKAIEVKRKDGSGFKLIRGDGDHWRVDGSEEKPAETTIAQYVTDVHDLKGHEIVADSPIEATQYGLDQPLLRITVSGEDNTAFGTVLIAQRPSEESKKDYVAMAENGPTVFAIHDYLITRLNKQAQDFVEKPTPTAGSATPALQMAPEADEPGEDLGEGGPGDENVPGDEQD